MEFFNLGIFLTQAVFYFALMIMLMQFRHWIGLGVFLAILGVTHFFSIYIAASFYFSFPLGLSSSLASIFFVGTIMLILILYLQEDAAVVRQPVYGLFLGSLVVVAMIAILKFQTILMPSETQLRNLDAFENLGWLTLWKASLFYVDSVFVILIYEKLGHYFKAHIWPRFLLASIAVVSFDHISFFGALRYFSQISLHFFWSEWAAKLLIICTYLFVFIVYERFFRRKTTLPLNVAFTDIFSDLTFRERYNTLLERSGRDVLTGVYSRLKMDSDIPAIFNNAFTEGQAITVLILDADHFKSINDRFGHLEGDEVLKAIANCLLKVVRGGDHIFRFGGEEFVVVSVGTTHKEGMLLAERLRRAISESVKTPDSQSVTVSLGVATAPDDGMAFKRLLSTADERLYIAKQNGRNCCVGGKVSRVSEPADL